MSALLLRHDSDHLRVFFIIYAVFFALRMNTARRQS